MRELTLPDWTRNLPNHTRMASKDVAAMLGISSSRLYKIIQKNEFISPNHLRATGLNNQKYFWTLGVLRDYVKEHSKKK